MSSIQEKLREKDVLEKRIEEKFTMLGIAHSSVHPRPDESFEEYSERIDELLQERRKLGKQEPTYFPVPNIRR